MSDYRFVTETRGHVWQRDGDRIDLFAYEENEYCNGPRCIRCGYGFCHHCTNGYVDHPCTGKKPNRSGRHYNWKSDDGGTFYG